MLWIDIKYVYLVSSALDQFKKKGEFLFNFRCPYCMDSQKKQNKKRGFLYRKNNDLFFKCHNCNNGTTFSKFIEFLDPILYKQYIMEKFMDNSTNKFKNFKKPELESSKSIQRFTDKPVQAKINLEAISELPDKHWVKEWVKNRKIPGDHWANLFFAPDFKEFIKKNYGDEKAKTLLDKEPRLVIPFFNSEKQVSHIQGRSLLTNDLRYITIKILDENKIYGLDRLDDNVQVLVVEGPLDSLFLKNCLAVAGGELSKTVTDYPDAIFVFDNEPWNEAIVDNMKRILALGKKIVVWPDHIKQKDINDMVLDGLDVDKLIKENSVSGLEGMAKFMYWCK